MLKRVKFSHIFLLLAFLSSAIWFYFFTSQQKFFRADFFDVGSGDAILLKTPDNFKVLIDGGPSSKILDHLGKSLGPVDRKIDLLIITHPHEDHIFGALEALNRYEVKMVLGTGTVHTSSIYLEFLNQVKKKNIDFKIAEQGQIYKFGDLELEILYPFESLVGKKVQNLNNSSIVFKAKYKKVNFLFLGDAEKEVGEKLFKKNISLSTSVLKVAHQGSKNGAQNFPGFLEVVKPQIAIILVGENKFGHPHKETLDKLEAKKIKILRTDEGSVSIESDGENFWVDK